MLKPVRDIRGDLRDRLSSIEEEEARMSETLRELGEQKAYYRQILEIEDARYRSSTPHAEEAMDSSLMHLSDFVLNLLTMRPRTKEEVRELAQEANYFSESSHPGRSIHATLTNLLRSKRAYMGDDNKYHLQTE